MKKKPVKKPACKHQEPKEPKVYASTKEIKARLAFISREKDRLRTTRDRYETQRARANEMIENLEEEELDLAFLLNHPAIIPIKISEVELTLIQALVEEYDPEETGVFESDLGLEYGSRERLKDVLLSSLVAARKKVEVKE